MDLEYILIVEYIVFINILDMCYERKRGGKDDYKIFFRVIK